MRSKAHSSTMHIRISHAVAYRESGEIEWVSSKRVESENVPQLVLHASHRRLAPRGQAMRGVTRFEQSLCRLLPIFFMYHLVLPAPPHRARTLVHKMCLCLDEERRFHSNRHKKSVPIPPGTIAPHVAHVHLNRDPQATSEQCRRKEPRSTPFDARASKSGTQRSTSALRCPAEIPPSR